MKKNLTKKLMLSVLTLAFAVVSLGASTFAWFTMSSNAKVTAFEGTVKGAEGVEIAVSPVSVTSVEDAKKLTYYSGQIDGTKIQDVITASGFTSFDAMTSQNGYEFMKLDHANGVVNQPVNSPSDGYIAFNLWFKSASTDSLNLTSLSFTSDNVDPYTMDQEFQLSADGSAELKTTKLGENYTFDVTSAARVAFKNSAGNVVIFEKSAEAISGTNAGNSNGFKTTDGAVQYYNQKEDKPLKVENVTGPQSVLYNKDLAVSTEKSQEIISLSAEQYDYVTVYVWIEGWDGECMNGIFKQKLMIEFEFYLEDAIVALEQNN